MPLNHRAVYPANDPQYISHASRRSVVHSINGMVASSQPLASEAGQRILRMGGNAADAAVAVAAALTVTEPSSTGIGGDMFCLYFDAKTREVHSLNGSGRSPKASSLEQVRKELSLQPGAAGAIPRHSGLSVTVPGAAAGWCDTVDKFGSGKLSMSQILTPAIELAEHGFPVCEISARFWQAQEQKLKDTSPHGRELLKRDPKAKLFVRAPRAGEVMKLPEFATTLKALAEHGKEGFYRGRIAKAIVDAVQLCGGLMTLEDLEDHLRHGTQETKAISIKFGGQGIARSAAQRDDGASDGHNVELWEHPPNGQGIVALMTLGILEELEKNRKIPTFTQEDHNSLPHLHAVIEALRIAFADAKWWVTDPDHSPVLPDQLLSRAYLAERAKLFDPQKANQPNKGGPGPSPAHNHCDTVYFAVTDKEGNGISFINSVYEGFGSWIVAEGTGFALQNRGCNFKLDPFDHPNIYAGGKRPYHTIIPALLTHDEGDGRALHSVYGVMGGFMQPQGHVQVLLNMEVFGLNPQQALDAPRICLGSGMPVQGSKSDEVPQDTVYCEDGIDEAVLDGLRAYGHHVEVVTGWARTMFGRGQVIRRHVDPDSGIQVYSAGSDLRGDGCAIPA